MTFGRRSPRINELLRQREDAERDLELATNPEAAADARATIRSLQHSLWLAGYAPEELA